MSIQRMQPQVVQILLQADTPAIIHVVFPDILLQGHRIHESKGQQNEWAWPGRIQALLQG